MTGSNPDSSDLSGGRHDHGPLSRRSGRFPVVALLLAVITACIVPALLLGLAATWFAVDNERAVAEERLSDVARDLALAFDQSLTGYSNAMLAFAVSPAFGHDAASADLPALDAQARRLAGVIGVPVGIVRPDGSRVMSSRVPPEGAMPRMTETGLIRRVIETGRPGVGEPVRGSISGKQGVSIAAPVFGSDGQAAFVVFATVPVQQFRASLMRSSLPPSGVTAVLSARGELVAGSDPVTDEHEALAPFQLPQPLTAERGTLRISTLQGVPYVAAYQKLKVAEGWVVLVAQPANVFDAAWHRPSRLFAIGGLILVLLAGALALVTSRMILRPLRQLAGHALAIAASNGKAALPAAIAVSPTRFVELEALRLGFAQAEASLRKQADRERAAAAIMADQRARLNALFEASPIGLGRCNAAGYLLQANENLVRMLGVSAADVTAGRIRWRDLTAPESANTTEQALAKALDDPDGQSSPYVKVLIRPDGVRVWALINLRILDRESQEAAVFVVDLTEAKHNEEQLRALLATIDLGAFMTRRLDGTIQHWSAGCERLYGWSTADAVGKSAHDLLQTAFPIPAGRIEQQLQDGGTWAGDLRQVHASGKALIVRAHKRLRRMPDGNTEILEMLTDVTEQRRVEAALAESEARLRAISDASPDLIYSKDGDGRLLYMNAAMQEVLGREQEAVLGQPTSVIHGNAAWTEEAREHDRMVMQTGQASTFQETMTDGVGKVRHVLSTKAPLRDPATDEVIGIAGISRDVTASLAAEAMRARLAAIVTSTLDAVISFAAEDGRIISWNQSAEALFGYAEAEALGRPAGLLVPSWLPDGDATGVFQATMTGEVIRDHETVRRRKDGQEIPVSVTAARMVAGDGSLLGVSAIFRDLRPRYAVEAALRESEARWRTLAESFPGIVFETGPDGLNTYTNSHFQAFAGLPAEQLLGEGWLDTLHPDDRARAADTWRQAVQTGGTYQAEYRFRAADGTYAWYKVRGTPHHDPDGEIVRWSGAAIDISEIVAAREAAVDNAVELERQVAARTRELEATQARLAQSAKMEALGRLAGGVAHDFNNVLQAVQGGIALARKRLATQPERIPTYLAIASEAAERGASVTGRLLAFARRSELSGEVIMPASLLNGLAHMLQHTLGPSVSIKVDVSDGLPPIYADKAQLETVLINLANNARDAMPQGAGTLWLAADWPAEAPAPLQGGGFIRITVRDNGAGMTPEVLARVSEPFFTTKPRGEGTGLGVAMARGFAEQSGGILLIESLAGQGTTVALWLPLAVEERRQPVSAIHEVVETSALRNARILVVDDEPMVRAIVAAALTDRGCKVTEAGDGTSALKLLHDGLDCDAMVTDLAMPGDLDGLALIQSARHHRVGLPALLLTGHIGDADEAALQQAVANGPFAMLHKPVKAEMLESKLMTLLRA